MELTGFLWGYRADGCGNTAYHPRMMVALLLFGYCNGITSSREIAKLCEMDVAFRVISANQFPDHSTISRFRKKHRQAFKTMFLEVLRLCRAGNPAMSRNTGMRARGRPLLQPHLNIPRRWNTAATRRYGCRCPRSGFRR